MNLIKESYLPLQISSALAETADDNVNLSESLNQGLTDTTLPTPTKVSLPPPIFIKGVLNYSDLLSELTELIGLNSFVCKSTSTHLKIQTENLMTI